MAGRPRPGGASARAETKPLLAFLRAFQYRNLRETRIAPLAQHNLIFGENGSGKTSLLEAAHILGTARSFRAGTVKTQVTHGEKAYAVQGECLAPNGVRRTLAVQRSLDGDVSLRIGGEAARSAAMLADELPLILLNSESYSLLVGEPANRRRFLDWGLFHVEHELRDHRQRFQRALLQRNHLLRRGKLVGQELAPWTADLAEQGEAVTLGRRRFLEALESVFRPLLARLAPDIGEVALSYRCGWDSSVSYAEALERGENSDREQGFTQTGPQRADIRVSVDGFSAADTLSRGQQKLLVASLKLAQGQLLSRQQADVLYLIDDLPAELDQERCERVCRTLSSSGAQSLITCIEPGSLPADWFGDKGLALFHVEHGSAQAL